MDKKSNSLNWFEIPATDIGRAKKFYESIFSISMESMQEIGGMNMVSFPFEMGSGKANGALVQSQSHKPSREGVVIYLNANPNIQAVIDRIEKAGGKIVMPKKEIGPDIGWMCYFIDSEGNQIALHAQN